MLTKSIAASVSNFRWQVTANHRRLTGLCDIVRRNFQVKFTLLLTEGSVVTEIFLLRKAGVIFFTNFNHAFVLRNDASTTEGRTTSFFITFREIPKDFNS